MYLDPSLPLEPPERYVEAVVRQARTSFYWAMRKLDPDRRRALFAVYAFCRVVDDIADSFEDAEVKLASLAAWRGEVSALYAGKPQHPIAKELAHHQPVYNLKHGDFLAVISGMELDAQVTVRLQSMHDLEVYCDQVACAVGRLCVRIFGLDENLGMSLAKELGLALQLTNILRDIAEDAARDRIYLPAQMLRDAGAEGETVQDALTAPHFADVCETIAEKAEYHFKSAQAIMSDAPKQRTAPARMMMGAYKVILSRLRRRGWQDLNVTVGLGRFEKLVIAVRYGFLN